MPASSIDDLPLANSITLEYSYYGRCLAPCSTLKITVIYYRSALLKLEHLLRHGSDQVGRSGGAGASIQALTEAEVQAIDQVPCLVKLSLNCALLQQVHLLPCCILTGLDPVTQYRR